MRKYFDNGKMWVMVYKRVSINRFPFCKYFLFGVYVLNNFRFKLQLNGYSSPFKVSPELLSARDDICDRYLSPTSFSFLSLSPQTAIKWRNCGRAVTIVSPPAWAILRRSAIVPTWRSSMPIWVALCARAPKSTGLP